MAFDKFEDLPGMIHELQDGGLQISETSAAPSVLILGTASRGPSSVKAQVVRAQESENRFGKEGTVSRGMYEAIAGGSTNTFKMRVNTRSAILYGVGTDDQLVNPTSIETLIRDSSAADLYFVRYTKPATLGPNAVVGRLKILNASGRLVYDSNPGGQPIDLGEVVVFGDLIGGEDIGALGDPEDFVSFRSLAQDRVEVDAEAAGVVPATPTVADALDLVNANTVLGSHVVHADGVELLLAHVTVSAGTGAGGVDQVILDSVAAGLLAGQAITVDYVYDADLDYNLRDGSDGLNPSRMELYEALEEAYRLLENDELDIVVPMDVYLDDKNVVDGDLIVLSENLSVPAGRRYPVPGSVGDALGKLHVEEYEGEFHYFWDIDGDGLAEIFPGIGAASASTKIDGSALESGDFHEVNFGYQLANFCFSLSVNDNECAGSIGVRGPKSFTTKDISRWIGEEPSTDSDGVVVSDGSGLLGNKFTAGTISRENGFFATFSGYLPESANFDADADIITDRNGHKVDIGKYLSLPVMPLTFFNPIDETGFGYQASMAALYAGFYSALPSNSAPTNKKVDGVKTPFRISKAKLNALAKNKMIAIKQKENSLRISDAPTAARNDSDFTRLTTVRIVSDAVDAVRAVAEPYIGEPNTALARTSLETGIVRELSLLQEAGFIQRFEARVSASTSQEIQGDATVELTLVPAFELRKITIITSLARQ